MIVNLKYNKKIKLDKIHETYYDTLILLGLDLINLFD